MRADQAS